MDKNVNFSISSKVLAAAALGAGIIVGAGTAYIVSRIHEHSNLTHLVSHLHTTIIEVKEELAHLENELGLGQRIEPLPKEEKSQKARNRKAVSFSSSATTSSYRTAYAPRSDKSSYKSTKDVLTDADSWRSPLTCESDYFSPEDDDDDDEFFDIVPTDDEGDELLELSSISTNNEFIDGSISVEVSELAKIIRKVDNLLDKSAEEQEEAYHLLMEKSSKYENNAEILWRMARATRSMASIAEVNGNLEKKKLYIDEGFGYAERALQINDKSAEIHKWYAILSGARGEYLSTKERIENGHVFKNHIDIALQLCPNDSTLHHLLGRFCFEVSLLTWVERKVAAAIFGEVPSSSFEEALEHFMAADELNLTGWKENKLFIAKSHFKLSNAEEGEKWLGRALRAPTLTPEDELMNIEIHELMKQHSIEEFEELSSTD